MKTKEDIKSIEDDINQLLYNVMDPEIELNIMDLGLVYSVIYDGDIRVEIKMTFSTPACPLGDALINSVKQSINNKYPDFEIDVQIVFEPRWTPDMISEKGKITLGM